MIAKRNTHVPPPALHHLSLKQLRLIAALDAVGTLRQAAQRVGLSQPRATKALQEAEALTACALFTRSNRGLRPTAAGQVAIRTARAMLAQLTLMEHELTGLAGGTGSRLRIGTIMGAVPFVTAALQRHLDRAPHTAVEIVEDTSAELLRQLEAGALDLVVGRLSVSPTPEAFCARAFHDEVLKVVAHPAHALAGAPRLGMADLAGARWIVYSQGMPMRLSLENEFRLAGLPFPASLHETRSALATMALIQGDRQAVALLSGDVAEFFCTFGMATTLALPLRSKSDPYEVITRAGEAPSEPVRQVLDDLLSGTGAEAARVAPVTAQTGRAGD
jgi:DNA-binding transcriptional LysR family regulator